MLRSQKHWHACARASRWTNINHKGTPWARSRDRRPASPPPRSAPSASPLPLLAALLNFLPPVLLRPNVTGGMAELAGTLLVGACAHASGSGAWRTRVFAALPGDGVSLHLTLLDDVAADGVALPCDAQVCVECVLPSGRSLELAVPATTTVADLKLRLRDAWPKEEEAPDSAGLAKNLQRTAEPAAANAHHVQPASLAEPPSETAPESVAKVAQGRGRLSTNASTAEALAKLSWALSGLRLLGAWHPATHVAALVAVVAMLTSLVGYLPICAAAVALLVSRVQHERHARILAQSEVQKMRAEVDAAHRQIAATVAALARADEASCGVMNNRGGAEEDTTLWLNQAFAHCWSGWLNAWLSSTLAAAVSDGLRQRRPAGLDEWNLCSLLLEDTPPRLSAPHILRSGTSRSADETLLAFGMSIVGDVALRMQLTATVSLLRTKLTLPVTLRASAADVTVALAFIRSPPYVRTVRVSLLAPPRISAQLGGVNFTDIPGIDAAVQGVMDMALRKILVAPNGHTWDIETWWEAEQLKARSMSAQR